MLHAAGTQSVPPRVPNDSPRAALTPTRLATKVEREIGLLATPRSDEQILTGLAKLGEIARTAAHPPSFGDAVAKKIDAMSVRQAESVQAKLDGLRDAARANETVHAAFDCVVRTLACRRLDRMVTLALEALDGTDPPSPGHSPIMHFQARLQEVAHAAHAVPRGPRQMTALSRLIDGATAESDQVSSAFRTVAADIFDTHVMPILLGYRANPQTDALLRRSTGFVERVRGDEIARLIERFPRFDGSVSREAASVRTFNAVKGLMSKIALGSDAVARKAALNALVKAMCDQHASAAMPLIDDLFRDAPPHFMALHRDFVDLVQAHLGRNPELPAARIVQELNGTLRRTSRGSGELEATSLKGR